MNKVRIENGAYIRDDQRLTLNANAIAQGYTADVIAKEFDKLGIMNYLMKSGERYFARVTMLRAKIGL